MFNWLMCHFDSSDPRGSLRKLVRTCIERSAFSGLNFLFSDGERLYAYKLGIFELHWLVRPGQTLVSSEIITPEESWHTVQQDVLLVLDPNRPGEPARRAPRRRRGRRAGPDREVRTGTAPPRRRTREVRGRARRARRGGRRRVSERRLALFANPAAAGGRALAALPAVQGELTHLGVQHRVVDTQSVDHARDEARRAAEDGETVVAVGGDGLVGSLAGALRGQAGDARDRPERPRQRLRARAEDPDRAARGGARRRGRHGAHARHRAGERAAVRRASRSLGFDSDANRIANEAKLVKGNLVYLYAALRALAGWKHARFRVTVDGREREVVGLLGRDRQLEGLRRRHVRVPAREARRRAARRR